MAIGRDGTVWVAFNDERRDDFAIWLAKIAPDGKVTLSAAPVATGDHPRLLVDGDAVRLTWASKGAVSVATVAG
jgi:hypothetical protein